MPLEPRVRRQLAGIAWVAGAALAALVLARGEDAARDVGFLGGWLYRVLTTFLGRAAAPAAPALAGAYGVLCLMGREEAARRVAWASPLALLAVTGWRQAALPADAALDPRSWPAGGGLLGGLAGWLLVTAVGPLGRQLVLASLAAAALAVAAGGELPRLLAGWVVRLRTAAGRAVDAVVHFVTVPEPVVESERDAEPAARQTPPAEPPPAPEREREGPPAPEAPEEAAGTPVPALEPEPPPPAVQERRPAGGRRPPEAPADAPAFHGEYRLPPLSLLPRGRARPVRGSRDAEQQGRELEETLASFGVQARVVGYQMGPAVTRFELEPAPGVKVSRIQGLVSDIALRLAVPAVRIEAPIPGKRAVGIEVPHREVAPVLLRDVLETEAFQQSPSPLTVALGMDTAGQPVVTTLERLLHVLIAGATGSGKSVCVNAMITSVLFKASPDQVRLVLIDPKMVELSAYNGIPHLLAPVVTDPKRAAAVLKWLVREMERRYERFAETGVRDVQRYNAVARERGEEPLPLIVVVIDELADLMMVAPVDVEDAIQRLAQMARAAGIHLVVATQRPSVDVITGVIKANIPSRIAFAVSSQTDSRVILDGAGAEKLLGRGDMLFYPLGASKPVRVQGAYLGERELEAVLEFVRGQGQPAYRDDVLSVAENGAAEDGEEDALFPEALRIVIETGQASASLLQRRLRIGYTRAGRLIDMMEARGFVGPHHGSKPRDVRITMEEYRRLFGERER